MKTFLSIAILLCASSCAALANVSTAIFLGNMLPQNETPPTTVSVTATALILVHQVTDSSGNLTSGAVEFRIWYQFPGADTITGMHIHNGAQGVAGPIVIPTDINSTTNTVAVPSSGKGTIVKQVQFGTGAGE